MKYLCLSISVLFLAHPALAQDAVPPKPCELSEEFRAFDFWLGEWEVFNRQNGQIAGKNTITAIESGCALLEKWTSQNGGTGTSLNLYNPLTKTWRQLWVSNGYNIDITGGPNKQGHMVLEGHIHYYQGQTKAIRGTWSALENGDVRQYFQEFDPTSESWTDWFDGIYKPAE